MIVVIGSSVVEEEFLVLVVVVSIKTVVEVFCPRTSSQVARMKIVVTTQRRRFVFDSIFFWYLYFL